MERKPPRPMTPFDNMVTPPYLYTLKLLLPYTPSTNQRFLAIYIKFLELRSTMEHFHGFPSNFSSRTSKSPATFGMFEDLKPYMGPEEQEMMEQMESMMGMMEMFQNMQDMGGGPGGDDAGEFNPMDMMMGMFNPEQQEMFNACSNMFDSDLEHSSKDNHKYNSSNKKEGADTHE